MSKELSEMTLEELWQLFPIILKEHNEKYKDWYAAEKEHLLDCIDAKYIKRINHIGSTSVKGLIAKPTVDILLEISDDCDPEALENTLANNGWLLMWSSSGPELDQTYNKGYTKNGFSEKIYHLHVRHLGDWDELYFRDYLMEHPNVAAEYAKLKLALFQKFEHNRDTYTDAKTGFVQHYSKIAKEAYRNRYKPEG